jgi:hypothetical protein
MRKIVGEQAACMGAFHCTGYKKTTQRHNALLMRVRGRFGELARLVIPKTGTEELPKLLERLLFRVTLWEETEITLRAELVKEFP